MRPGPEPEADAGRATRALIDVEAFAHNVRLAVRLAGPGRQVLAVVKADAYGHGAAVLGGAALAAGEGHRGKTRTHHAY
ncbi:MAG TPA: alanine racemase, partial [bacterium]